MADYSNIPLGLKITTQIPLDVKSYVTNEATLKDLGSGNNLAFTYYKGAIFYCVEEGTRYQWREVVGAEAGLMASNYTYPPNVVAFGITYSNKAYNFFPILISGQLNSDWNSESGVTKILNKPTIPSITGLATVTYVDAQDALKVDKVAGSRLITSAESIVLGNTSGTNTGDNAVNTLYSGLEASKEDKLTLTSNNTSGAATLIGGVLNIPQYSNSQTLQAVTSSGNTTNIPIKFINNDSTILKAVLGDNTKGLFIEMDNNATGIDILNNDAVGTVPFIYRKYNPSTEVYATLIDIDNDGNISSESFIKNGGLPTEYLMADGSTSLAANKENSANKQNSLVVDGTGVKFPTVDAVNAGISSANYWTKTGNDIYNNNTGNIIIGGVTVPNPSLPGKLNIVGNIYTSGKVWSPDAQGFRFSDGSSGMYNRATQGLEFVTYGDGTSALGHYNFTPIYPLEGIPNSVSGTTRCINTSGTYAASSGSVSSRIINIEPIINQTGTANGIIRGIYINPTLTSAYDFRAIEVVIGKVIVPTAANSNEAINKGQLESYTTAQLASKMNNPSLTASYIPKALTATTIGNSRLLDDGTYLGIGTVNAPTKDITLGYQANREIGIELSDSTTIGRDLTVTAGKTVNYSLNSDFVALNQAANSWWGVCGHVNGNVYATVNSGAASGGIYTQTGGIGNFNQTTSNFASQIFSITCLPNGNIYVVTSFPGIYKQTNATGSFVADATAPTVSSASILASDTNNNIYLLISGGAIYKKTNDTGSFVLISITARNYNFITCHPNGNVYASVSNGDIYMQTGGIGDFNPLSQTSRTWSALACTSNGNVYAYASSSIYIQTAGTGNFVLQSGLTARNYIRLGADINGNMYGTGTDIYKQINATLGTPNLQGGTLKLYSGTGKGTGASDIEMWTGQVLASGTDMQISTLRAKINNEGLMTLPSVTNALIDADTTGKAVVTKEYVATLVLPTFLEYNAIEKTVWNNGQGNIAANTSFGASALKTNTTGTENSAFGVGALRNNTSGSYNTAIGFSLLSNTVGSNNISIGYISQADATIASSNVSIGNSSLYWNIDGNGNTAIGHESGVYETSNPLTKINNSVFIGKNTRAFAVNDTNEIVIGADATGAGSNTATLGNDSITSTILKGLVKAPLTTNALIEADTTGKAVVTKEYVNNRLVVETTSGYTLTNADSGGIIIFTASTTLTIPTGLADGFECTFVTLSGVTLTVVSTGNTLNNATSTTMLPQLSFTLKRMLAANTYIVAGSL